MLVFMTDGIIEVHDVEGKEYQDSGRLQRVLTQFTPEMSAEAMVAAIIDGAMGYSGENDQREDDMTVVVVKVQ